MTITAEVKNTLDNNFDMIVLATKNLGVKECDFELRFNDILAEVCRMQLETYNKLTTNKELLDNANKVMCSKVYLTNKISHSFNSFR